MNYEKIYYDFCSSRQQMNREKNKGTYFEEHHIKPKSLFPELKKTKENLVLLTAREHYLAHLLLIRFTTGEDKFKMICAFCRFCHGKNAEKFKNGKEYEKYRLLWHSLLSEKFKGKKRPIQVIQKMMETRRNGDNWKVKDETKDKLSKLAKAQFSSEESKKHHSEIMKMYYAEHPETHTGIYKGTKLGPRSQEVKDKVKNAVVNSEKWKNRYYNIECVETGERFSCLLLEKTIGISRHLIKKGIKNKEDINGKHYKYIEE